MILLHQSQFEKHECQMSDVILKCHVYNIQMYWRCFLKLPKIYHQLTNNAKSYASNSHPI